MKAIPYVLFVLMTSAVLLLPLTGSAATEGSCSNCHVTHDFMSPLPGLFDGFGGDDCIGCHLDADMQNTKENFDIRMPPQVNKELTPLAAGWFYSSVPDPAKDGSMHNVSGVSPEDETLGNTPPGGETLANRLECVSCHLRPNHHASNPAMVSTNYRFLSGILGKGDRYWELSAGATTHNQYREETKTMGQEFTRTDTMSFFCARCHGLFHSEIENQYGWSRHPIGADISALTGEYNSYSMYDPLVPVGSLSVDQTISNTIQTAGNGLVSCVSCHRAHGSNYKDLLRWDPDSATGCYFCHSTKT